MLIDWFTVAAQVVNFLILVWLLKRFLYKPIVRAIDERDKQIVAQLTEAEAKKAEAQKERDDFQRKNESFDQERQALSKQAADNAQAERQRLLDEARKEADSLRSKLREAVRNEQDRVNHELADRIHQEVFLIARKALMDLATTNLEAQIIEVFIHRLSGLSGAEKEQLAKALQTSPQPALVRSAFEVPPSQQSALSKAIKESFATEIEVDFKTTPNLVGGIELSANGQKVTWSIADYLASLEKSTGEWLEEKAKPEAKPNESAA
jgi:F-type H+-transporting ATPase subunit b